MNTPKMQEVASRLPNVTSQKLAGHIWHTCQAAGINLDKNLVLFLERVCADFFVNTEEGKHAMLKMLGADINEVDPTKSYYQAGFIGDERAKVHYKDLKEFRGWIVKRVHGVGYRRIVASEVMLKEACEDCGGLFPKDFCTETVTTFGAGGKQHIKTLCNRCRMMSSDFRIRDSGSSAKCKACLHRLCDYHPQRQERPLTNVLALPAPQRYSTGGF